MSDISPFLFKNWIRIVLGSPICFDGIFTLYVILESDVILVFAKFSKSPPNPFDLIEVFTLNTFPRIDLDLEVLY